MTRKVHRVPVTLDTRNIKALPEKEIAIILRGADELIMRGGRTLLAKVLKGSREKKLRETGLDTSPAYGALRTLSMEDILARIDWLISNRYLAIEYDYRLPLLVYTQRGWEIERQTYVAEMHARIDDLLATSDTTAPDLTWLNDKNRQVIMLLLERIEGTGDHKYIPALEGWSRNTFKKVRSRICRVIETLRYGKLECVTQLYQKKTVWRLLPNPLNHFS